MTATLNFELQTSKLHSRGMAEPLMQIELPGIPKIKSGKVREIFDLGDSLLMVATDRISAFDCIMPNGIPRKGEVLTQISHFWFEKFAGLVPNHLLAKARSPRLPR
jgi:phosphoribosylaminoimidazole-succinocarboxamide synthase